jgi:hypothetical protein
MYTPYHLAAGALAEKGMKTRVPTAGVALLSHFILDNLLLRHPVIEPVYHIDSPWPEGTPAIIAIVPYPDSILSAVVLAVLVILTPIIAFMLRRYWWGMLWAVSPDIIDWIILYPIFSIHPIHNFSDTLSTSWGLAIEMTLLLFIVGMVLVRRRVGLRNDNIAN